MTLKPHPRPNHHKPITPLGPVTPRPSSAADRYIGAWPDGAWAGGLFVDVRGRGVYSRAYAAEQTPVGPPPQAGSLPMPGVPARDPAGAPLGFLREAGGGKREA
jgi:hypothetical protein